MSSCRTYVCTLCNILSVWLLCSRSRTAAGSLYFGQFRTTDGLLWESGTQLHQQISKYGLTNYCLALVALLNQAPRRLLDRIVVRTTTDNPSRWSVTSGERRRNRYEVVSGWSSLPGSYVHPSSTSCYYHASLLTNADWPPGLCGKKCSLLSSLSLNPFYYLTN